MIEDEWDQRYAESDRIWSGRPNQAMVAEVSDLTPGRVLDVGCGEGADAIWLAGRGWRVTALEVSRVALDRARQHAQSAGVEVQWVHAPLLEASLPPDGFDLVSALYPALRQTPDHAAERALMTAVAAGGILLVVHHVYDPEQAGAHGFDPADDVSPADVAAALDDDWVIEIDEERPRHVATGAGARHTRDVVLRARRLNRGSGG